MDIPPDVKEEETDTSPEVKERVTDTPLDVKTEETDVTAEPHLEANEESAFPDTQIDLQHVTGSKYVRNAQLLHSSLPVHSLETVIR